VPDWWQFDDPALEKGYTVVPNTFFELGGMTPGAKYLYLLLLSKAQQRNSVRPSQVVLMADLGASRNTLRAWMEELESTGVIRREKTSGMRDVIHFLALSHPGEGETEGSKSDPLSEIDGPQNLTGTLSKSDRVGGDTLSKSDRDNPYRKYNGQEDVVKDSSGGETPPARAKSARSGNGETPEIGQAKGCGTRRRPKGESKLSPEQNRVKQAAVDRLHTRIREYTNMANPPAYSDAAAAGYFAERVLAGDTEADFTEGIEVYLGRLDQQKADALRRGRRITPHGSFAFLKSSWGSILQQIADERERRNTVHRRGAKAAERTPGENGRSHRQMNPPDDRRASADGGGLGRRSREVRDASALQGAEHGGDAGGGRSGSRGVVCGGGGDPPAGTQKALPGGPGGAGVQGAGAPAGRWGGCVVGRDLGAAVRAGIAGTVGGGEGGEGAATAEGGDGEAPSSGGGGDTRAGPAG
jgi:hypothetical protein